MKSLSIRHGLDKEYALNLKIIWKKFWDLSFYGFASRNSHIEVNTEPGALGVSIRFK